MSCNYEKLVLVLEDETKEKPNKEIKPWEPLEDLALKGAKDSAAYKYVVDKRKLDDIVERKRFLELED